jgi:hypothetical protein
VKETVERSLRESQEVVEAMGVPLDRLRLRRQTEAALEEHAAGFTDVPR